MQSKPLIFLNFLRSYLIFFISNIIQYLALQSIVCYSIHNPKLILPEMCYQYVSI